VPVLTTEDYVNASEAARMLGVSRQRVAAMVRDDEIDHVRPWPRQVLIPRSAIDAYAHGDRRPPIHKTACRDWILAHERADSIDNIDADRVGQLCVAFIVASRPDWDATSIQNWVAGMIGLLYRMGGAPR